MADEGRPANDVTKYRLEDLEKWRDRVEVWRAAVDEDRATLKADIRGLKNDMARVVELGERGQKVLVGLLGTIAGSAVLFALSILAATDKI